MHILFTLPEFGPGGAERVVSILANEWSKKGAEVSIACFWGRDETPFYSLDSRVSYRSLDLPNVRSPFPLGAKVNRFLALRRHIQDKDPDVIVSFLTRANVFTLLASRGLDVPVVVAERNHPVMKKIPAWWRKGRDVLYPQADALVVQTQEALQFYNGIAPSLTVAIPNPFVVNASNVPSKEAGAEGRRKVVAAGRLVHQKGFDLLLHAFAKVAKDNPAWDLEIWGEGEKRLELEALRDRLELVGRARLPGVTDALQERMAEADLFVLSSRYEGFPNVLLEAMSMGLPSISFNCPYGPSEMIQDGQNGILVEPGDVNALATAIDGIIRNRNTRAAISKNAGRSIHRYRSDNVITEWNTLLTQVLGDDPIHHPMGDGRRETPIV